MSEETIWDLSMGLLQIFKSSPKFVCPRFVSLILELSSWNLDFVGMSWNFKTTSFSVIFSPKEDDEDAIIYAQSNIH